MKDKKNKFEPSHLDDPIAMQTAWFPKEEGSGSSFQTHKLVKVSSNRVKFRATIGVQLIYIIFILIFIGMMVGAWYGYLASGFSFTEHSYELLEILALVAGVVGCVFGIQSWCVLYYQSIQPIVFDKASGFFWKGWKEANCELDKINALQLISKKCTGDESSYYSYELNLILKNGNRINVLDHGDREKLREDTSTLSFFLKKPIWDAT